MGAGQINTQHQSQRVWRTLGMVPCSLPQVFVKSNYQSFHFNHTPATSQPQSGWNSSSSTPTQKSLTSVSEHPLTLPHSCLKVKEHCIIIFFPKCYCKAYRRSRRQWQKFSKSRILVVVNSNIVVAIVLRKGLHICGFLSQTGIDWRWRPEIQEGS